MHRLCTANSPSRRPGSRRGWAPTCPWPAPCVRGRGTWWVALSVWGLGTPQCLQVSSKASAVCYRLPTLSIFQHTANRAKRPRTGCQTLFNRMKGDTHAWSVTMVAISCRPAQRSRRAALARTGQRYNTIRDGTSRDSGRLPQLRPHCNRSHPSIDRRISIAVMVHIVWSAIPCVYRFLIGLKWSKGKTHTEI